MKLWEWIRDQDNREALKFIGVAIVAIPASVISFINWSNNDEISPGKTIGDANKIIELPTSRADKLTEQLILCLNGTVVECKGLGYKIEEADLRCRNNIREKNPEKRSFAENKCTSMKGKFFQIRALTRRVGVQCYDINSSECDKALDDAKYHSKESLHELALYLDKYS